MVTTSCLNIDLSFCGRSTWLPVHHAGHPDMVHDPDKASNTTAKLAFWPGLDSPVYYDGNSGFPGVGQQGKGKHKTDGSRVILRSAGPKCPMVADILYTTLAFCGIRGDSYSVAFHIAYYGTIQ